jgi:hypothetical protein
MNTVSTERRTRRSNCPPTALQWLLEAQVSRGALTTAVIASDEGLLVAAVGSDAEITAALAPWIADQRPLGYFEDTLGHVSVRSFVVQGQRMHIALRGGDHRQHDTLATLVAQGAERILHH